jgi:hypothetical protein
VVLLMNIKNLSMGMIIKNYKDLCEVLELKITSGASKQAQIKEMERCFKYHKEGNKFVIDEIYSERKASVDKRHDNKGGANNIIDYVKTIEKLILNLLFQDNNKNGLEFGKIFLSKNQILKEFKMINSNYVYCKRHTVKLSKFMDINQETVDEWYTSSDGMLERNLEYALKSLENQCLIVWSKEITVAEAIPMALILEEGTRIIKKKTVDKYGDEIIDYKYHADKEVSLNYREGTDSEKIFITNTEREILEELKCKGKQEVIKMGMWDIFKEKVDKIVLKELNLAFYYKSYKILFSENNIENAVRDMYEEFAISKEEQEFEQNKLNSDIVDRLVFNTNKRYSNAVEEKSKIYGKLKDDFEHNRLMRRSDKDYINDNCKLNDTLIVLNAKNITDSVKKTKVEKNDVDIDKQMDELFGKFD